jgi:hypothetical protein
VEQIEGKTAVIQSSNQSDRQAEEEKRVGVIDCFRCVCMMALRVKKAADPENLTTEAKAARSQKGLQLDL